ncbi:MFS transporter [Kaistia dalseonensis]|uniref:MFS family permease n=1 Tax=Kaistia dalseonensis TaxID=410840 RepID=A0ABU0H5D5_9HYPH|nr:MFS transporter [Kaistia dalseonensis]MCX5494396.1 MFS transporter [Kaistia dalseonensis]MDQ0436975.1 MFS family permease [Kaistia dalseonensis]
MSTTTKTSLLFVLIASGTVLGIAGTDLVLPAVPSLPLQLGGSVETAQFVLAAYAFGTLIGLLIFGELGARLDPCKLFMASLALFGAASLAASASPSIEWLIALRFAQGAFGAGPAVFAPGFIQGLYAQDKAASALGRLGSIESLAPALAPIAGAYLLELGGWRLSFVLLAVLSVLIGTAVFSQRRQFPRPTRVPHGHHSYLAILRNREFISYASSQALSLGGLLVFVFGAPAVLTGPLGKGIAAFVVLQVFGIAAFILAANSSAWVARTFGTLRTIRFGTAIMPLAFLAILVYALGDGSSLYVLVPIWMAVNLGFGIRGPIGFHRAITTARGDHSRAAAIIVAAILGIAGLGTTLVAPYIAVGLWPLAIAGTTLSAIGLLSLLPLREGR